MNINPKECKILLTEPPMNPITNREKMIEVTLHNPVKVKSNFTHYKIQIKNL